MIGLKGLRVDVISTKHPTKYLIHIQYSFSILWNRLDSAPKSIEAQFKKNMPSEKGFTTHMSLKPVHPKLIRRFKRKPLQFYISHQIHWTRALENSRNQFSHDAYPRSIIKWLLSMSQVLRENDYYSWIVSPMEPVRKHAKELAFLVQTTRRDAIHWTVASLRLWWDRGATGTDYAYS